MNTNDEVLSSTKKEDLRLLSRNPIRIEDYDCAAVILFLKR